MRRIALVAALVSAACAAGLQPVASPTPPATAGEYAADLSARRERLMTTLGPEAALVLWSAPARVYSADVNYEYRQESNLLYLSGIEQERTILVLIPGATSAREVLFVPRADPVRALWSGPVLTPAEVTARSGVAHVYPQRGTEEFDAFMAALFGGTAFRPSPAHAEPDPGGAFFAALRRGQARLGVLGRFSAGDAAVGGPVGDAPVGWAREVEARYPGITAFGAGEILTAQRRIKTPYEQRVLARSVEISAQAHVEGMRAARPGRWEFEVEAAIEHWFLRNGAMSWGYPSIVASGPNATILHYLDSARQMQRGDLLLVDAAANYQGLTGDITRTYPVTGRFSDPQRTIYALVLQAQEAGIAAARPGRPVEDVVDAVRGVLGAGLEALGLVSATLELDRDVQIDAWFPHDPVHGIGMDVHEPLDTLDPGTAFVIEPGLYIRPAAFDRLPDTPAAAAFVDLVRPAVEKYRDIGVRVEDSFLMGEAGPRLLSGQAPRRIAEVERTVGKGR